MSELARSIPLIRVECLSSRGASLLQKSISDNANVWAPVLMSAELWPMSQFPCSFLLQMLIPSNVWARVLISADLCLMSELPCSFPMPMQ